MSHRDKACACYTLFMLFGFIILDDLSKERSLFRTQCLLLGHSYNRVIPSNNRMQVNGSRVHNDDCCPFEIICEQTLAGYGSELEGIGDRSKLA